ncbi:MAG: hypothetical protein ABIO57_03675 [Candidatus Paceibacterota bacterium]
MTRQEVIDLMRGSASAEEWEANIRTVKDAFDGYPDFWYEAIIASNIADEASIRFKGSAGINVTAMGSRPLELYGRPTSMPVLGKDDKVIGIYDQGLGDKRMECKSLEQMQGLYDSYAQGWALKLRWEISTTKETVIPTH